MIKLERELNIDERIKVGQETLSLPLRELVLMDTSILFPVIFPPNKRNADALARCSEEKSREKVMLKNKTKYLAESRKIREREIKVVDGIERGEFQKKGLRIGLLSKVHEELSGIQGAYRTDYLNEWIRSFLNCVYYVEVNLELFYEKYSALYSVFRHGGDFSLAVTSYQLGCDFATDDYNSFNIANMKMLNRMYFERWGLQKKLNKHDSESLLLLLRRS